MQAREFHNLIIIGTIDSVTDTGDYARVIIGEEILTKLLPLPALYGKNFTAALPARIGSQVVLTCPSGDVDAGVIVGFLWTGEIKPHETRTDIDSVKFNDGTTLAYDSESKVLSINCAGKVEITAADDMSIVTNGRLNLVGTEVSISGPVIQTGGDMTSDGVSAQKHKHAETNSITKAPQ